MTSTIKLLLVLVAVLIGVVVALIAAILTRLGGAGPSASITSGGVAFGGAVGLVLVVENALGLL
jgi:hypothetical protein